MARSAFDTYRMWHNNRQPDAVNALPPVRYPDFMAIIGYAHEILYWSDKFQKRGQYELFEHQCTSHAEVFEERARGDVPIGVLMGDAGFKGKARKQFEVADLAFMEELTFKRTDGRMQTVEFDVDVEPIRGAKNLFHMKYASTVVLAPPDHETLVLVPDSGKPTIIRGADMRITARGIVR